MHKFKIKFVFNLINADGIHLTNLNNTQKEEPKEGNRSESLDKEETNSKGSSLSEKVPNEVDQPESADNDEPDANGNEIDIEPVRKPITRSHTSQ